MANAITPKFVVIPTFLLGANGPFSTRDFIWMYITRLFPLSLCAFFFLMLLDSGQTLESFSTQGLSDINLIAYGILAAPIIETLALALILHILHLMKLFPTNPIKSLVLCGFLALLFSLSHIGDFYRHIYIWLVGLVFVGLMYEHWTIKKRVLSLFYGWLAHLLFNVQALMQSFVLAYIM